MPTAAGSAEGVDHYIGLLRQQANLDEDSRAAYEQALRTIAGVLEQDPDADTFKAGLLLEQDPKFSIFKKVVIAPGNPERDTLLLQYCGRLASPASDNLIRAAKILREFKTPAIAKKLEEDFELIKELLAENNSAPSSSTKGNHEIALKALAYLLAHFPGARTIKQILCEPENADRALMEKYKQYFNARDLKTATTHLLAAVKGIQKRNANNSILNYIKRVREADLSPATKRGYSASITAAAEWLAEDDERGTFAALVNSRRPAKDDPIVQDCQTALTPHKPDAAKRLPGAIDFFRPEPLHQPFFRLLVRAADLSAGTLKSYKIALNALEQWLEDNRRDQSLAEILTARGDAAQDQTLQQCRGYLVGNKTSAATHLFWAVNAVRRTIQAVKQEDYRLIDRLLARISEKFNTDCYKVALTALADWLAQDPQDRTLAQILAEVGPGDDDDGILSACKRHLEACGMTDAATYLIPAINAVRPVNTDRGNLPEPDIAEVQRSDFVSVVEEMAKLYLAPEGG